MGNRKTSEKKDSWLKVLLGYTEGSGQRLGISVVLSVISIIRKKCLYPAKKYKLYKSSINKSLHFAQKSLSSSTRG
jgi:hypothetical protein